MSRSSETWGWIFGSSEAVRDPFRVIHHGSVECRVYAGSGILTEAAEILDAVAPGAPRFLIASKSVYELHGHRLPVALSESEPILIDDGEQAKTLKAAEEIVTALLDRGVRRDAVVVVFGGGVAGDTGGFAASIFLRGIRLVHVPTTLLAQVDSSIGGKHAVNHPLGKNLIGSFHPPSAVLCDLEVLQSLPRREILSGTYEALKSGVIGDPELFELIEGGVNEVLAIQPKVMEELVRRSIEVKGSIVEADEKEADLRRLLNYGHTLGHALEAATGFCAMSHGEAVGWGMIGANAIARRRGLLDRADADRISDAVLSYRPARPPEIRPEELLEPALRDKKFTSTQLVMALPRAVGRVEVFADVSTSELGHGIEAMLEVFRSS